MHPMLLQLHLLSGNIKSRISPLLSETFPPLSVCLKVSSCLLCTDLWLPASLSLPLKPSLNNPTRSGRKCLFDANPNKSAAVREHSLRCLRVLAQTCLMSWSADIYSAAAELHLHKERERETTESRLLQLEQAAQGEERRGCCRYRSAWWADQLMGRIIDGSYRTGVQLFRLLKCSKAKFNPSSQAVERFYFSRCFILIICWGLKGIKL